jgi:hypothetical protein
MVLLVFAIVTVPLDTMAQAKPPAATAAAPTTPTAPAGGAGGGGLQGISFARQSWESRLAVPPEWKTLGLRHPEDLVFVCYKLVPGKSATQPFVLEPDAVPQPWHSEGPYANGNVVSPTNSNGYYYEAEIKMMPSGDTPPKFPTATNGSMVADQKDSNLFWQDKGDVDPKDVKKHEPWVSTHPYSEGEQIIESSHYYQAVFAVESSVAAPTFRTDGGVGAESSSPILSWQDEGEFSKETIAARGIQPWTPNHPYSEGNEVVPPIGNQHIYKANINFIGRTGKNEPDWKTSAKAVTVDNGGYLIWKNLGLGVSNPNIGANCRNISPSQPILMDQILVVAIDVSEVPEDIMNRFRILNLNITNQQGTSLNPTPIRPSLTQGAASGAETAALQVGGAAQAKAYFLTWPNQLPGDTIPTISVNLVYTPVAPGLPWARKTFYPAGSIVISNNPRDTNGHYYIAVNAGISGDTPPGFDDKQNVTEIGTFNEGTGLSWKDMGPTPPPPPPVTGTPISPPAASVPLSPTLTVWKGGKTYGIGELVIPPPTHVTGHYYKTENGGTANTAKSPFVIGPKTFNDGPTLIWRDMGPTVLTPPAVSWTANTAYAKGARVTPNPPNGDYYEAQSAGVTNPNPPPFSFGASPIIETREIRYVDAGTALPSNARLRAWAKETAFFLSDAVLDLRTGHYYLVTQAGISADADNPPSFTIPAPRIVPSTDEQPIIWQDFGTTLPASVSLGTPPSDLTVNALTYTYPQVHALSRFNLASGVVISTAKARNIIAGTTTGTYIETPTSLTIDPILAVTVYPWPMDAERRFHREDFRPGATLGISLSAPTKNFYVGGSSEFFVRNLQLTYGLSIVNTNVLGPANMGIVTTTKQKFVFGGFVGFTFDITGFIQSLIP